ncbi:hypothetical protein AN480_27385 (plasmid) [Mycobacterium intracellulare subsp. chimaera]|uniref:Uncharacterized protein n=1 Tax=Mycobacterium intracellulare subsp. chimaera TaxID=222805 RepID=A0ABT7P384_MYCIT|nr:hypothetical protein [Mycobacterium intracellulare]AOS94814.1 hypothetical protein AN480_27385 [Mycobacterium intracellulare subsp. chimaera]MDM3927748.1 hypothetical protein [Mycobacterium intracellulare subsp. chimaera]
MDTTAGLLADAKNRAELLTSRFTALNDGNPGFSYQGHLSGVEKAATGGDSVTTALFAGPAGLADLERLLADDETFVVWHLRLGHPLWWIGLTVQYTTTLLKKIVSDLADEPQDGPELPSAIELLTEPGGIQQFLAGAMPAWAYSPGGTGYPGAHWFSQTTEAITPLSARCRDRLRATLRLELVGRQLCTSTTGFLNVESAALALLSAEERTTAGDAAALADAVDAVENVHGHEWATAFTTMAGELDPITWAGLTEALAAELETGGLKRSDS